MTRSSPLLPWLFWQLPGNQNYESDDECYAGGQPDRSSTNPRHEIGRGCASGLIERLVIAQKGLQKDDGSKKAHSHARDGHEPPEW